MAQTTLARFDAKRFSGPQTDAAAASALMREAAENWNFVSPAPSVAAIPEGCALAFSAVVIDAKHDTYPIPGSSKVGLTKPALDRIKGALGVRPIPQQCGQIDDGSDQWFVQYVWNGYYRDLDGTIVPLIGEKKIDLREGSALVTNLRRIAAKRGRDAADEIAQTRSFILEHASTKARLRAIRSLGIKTSYEPAELAKPFVAVRLSFTGNFQDPEARAHYQRRLTDSFMDDTAAAFGGKSLPAPGSGTPATALPDSPPVRRLPPPPVGQADDIDDADLGGASAPTTAGTSPSTHTGGPAPDQVRHAEGSDQVRMPGKKGGTVAEAEYDDLVYWRGKVAAGLDADPNGKYAANNRKQLAMIEAEIAARDDTTSSDETEEGGDAPAAAAPSPERIVPTGLPGEGRAIDALDDQVLADLQAAIMQRLSAAQASGKVAPERLKTAQTFLDAVTTLRDVRRGPGGTKAEAPAGDDQWLADLSDGGKAA